MRLKVREFSKDIIIGVGRRIGSKGKPVIVGRDARLSSRRIYNAVVSGILEIGGEAYLAEVYPTPGIMYEAYARGYNAIVVTASHNPPEYNGFKALIDSLPVPREEVTYIQGSSSRDSVVEPRVCSLTYYPKMLEREAEKLEKERRAIIDYGHGVGSLVSKHLSRKVKHVSLFGLPDGRFPMRASEPTEENLSLLLKTFDGYEIGFAFDGDADRCVVIDDRGRYVNDHVMLALYASYLADRGAIVTHIGASVIVNELVEAEGGKVIRTRVGDPFLARAAKENQAAFAGEPNGARIHPDIHYFPDGPLTLLRILRMLEERGEKLSSLVDSVPKTYVLRDSLERKRGYEEADECIKQYAPEDALEVVTVDGIRVRTEKSERFLVRPSATEPLIRISAEARRLERAKELLRKARHIAEKCV